MKKEENLINKLKSLCKFLVKFKSVKCIFLYGSSAKKYIKGHDIDIFIVIDDTQEGYEDELPKLKFIIEMLEKQGEKYGLKLHFQPPKPLSLVWHLVRIAEPWTISAIRTSIVLYDPSDFIKIIKKLLKKGKIYAVEEKAERLFTRAVEGIASVREEILKLPIKLLNVVTIVSQMLLSYLDIYTTSSHETRDKIKEKAEELGISRDYIEFYDELIKINEKISRGTLSEFSGEELDIWEKRIKNIVEEAKFLLVKLQEEEEKKRIEDSYAYALNLCKKALSMEEGESDEKIIESFKEKFIKTGKVPKEYYNTIKKLQSYLKTKKRKGGLEFVDKLYFRGMEVIINEAGKE